MERAPGEQSERPPLYVNLMEEGRNIFSVVAMAQHVLAEQLFIAMDQIAEEVTQGDEVAWDNLHTAALNFALLKRDIIEAVGKDSISRHHDLVLEIINKHLELVDTSGAYEEYGGQPVDQK